MRTFAPPTRHQTKPEPARMVRRGVTVPPADRLPERLRAGAEALGGFSLADVKVHHDSPEPAKLGALAFARGSDIHLGPGQERHLPHEAWHVVQQKQGRVVATRQMKGVAINRDLGLEAEADNMADRAKSSSASEVGAAGKESAALGSAADGSRTHSPEVLQLQNGGKGSADPLTKSISAPQDNTRVALIDKRIAEATAKQHQAQIEAEKSISPEMKKFAEQGKLNPELYKWAQAEMVKKVATTTVSQGRKLTPFEQEYSDLWRLEYQTRDKYCTEFEKKQLETYGGFKNGYVQDRLYVLQNSGAALWLNPGSPISVWKFLEMFGRLFGRGPSVPGQVKMGMKSQIDRVPFTQHTTLVNPSAGLPSVSSTKLGPRDM